MIRKLLLASALLAFSPPVLAQTTIKVGIVTDMGGMFSDFAGAGSLAAAKLAAEDYMAAHPDVKIEVISAEHQNKPDLASSIARKWYDEEGVDVIADVTSSSAALAVANIAREKNKVYLATSAATTDLTGAQCNPNTVHWLIDAYGQAQVAKVVGRGENWFFVTADYAYGYSIEAMAAAIIKAEGGNVIGRVRHPSNTADFSSFPLQAQDSKAKVVALASAGSDLVTAIKQSKEFGISAGGQTIAGFAVFLSDIHAIGLPDANGIQFMTSFYWDLNDNTRAFTKKFAAVRPGLVPTQVHAANYSGLMLYFDSARRAGTTKDGAKVVAAMRDKGRYDDPLFGPTTIRTDGRASFALYQVKVKTPQESKGKWDYYTIMTKVPPEQASRSLAESKAAGCALAQ